jgi:hypothetical protein
MRDLWALVVVISLALPAAATPVGAQQPDSTAVVQIQTTDGNAYVGTIIAQDSAVLLLRSDRLGEITIRRSDILRIVAVNPAKIAQGAYWFDNPQSTRYFWAPDGYGLKKGEGYYQNVWVLFNQVSVGITDNFSVGAGVVPLFLFGGASTPAWITPKFSIPISPDKFNIGIGGLFGGVLGESNSSFGIAYGVTTFGSRDRNFTVGAGYGYSDGQWAKAPVVTFSAMIRTGPHGYFITENYYISTSSDDLVLLSLGGRRIINKAGLDFGLFIPLRSGQSSFIAIPWLGLTLPFGNVPKS